MLRPYQNLAKEALGSCLRVALHRSKVHVARRLKEVTDPTRRDFFNSHRARKHRKEPISEHNKILFLEDTKPLSKFEQINEKYEEVQYNADKYNKDTRESVKLKLDESFEAMAIKELQHPDTIISPEADKRNRINAAEYEKFRLEYYRKNELSRLINKAQKHQQVGLYGPGYQDNSNFTQELLNRVRVLQEQSQYTGNHSKIEDVRISEMGNYQAELRNLKNDRIDGLLGLHNSNPKLKELMEFGFMDKSKPIGEVFELMQAAKSKHFTAQQRSTTISAAASILGMSASGLFAETSAQVTSVQGQDSSASGVSSEMRTYSSNRLQAEIQEQYKSLVDGDPVKQTAMEMVLHSMDERGLRGSPNSNYYGLVQFIQEFMEMDQQDKADLLERISRVQQVREFEERVLKEREDHILEGRGKPSFDALKPDERVPYVKHNVHLYQDVFKIVKSHENIVKNDPAFAAALIEKLAMGWTLAPLFYKNDSYVDLHTIAQPEYMTLMKQVKNNLPDYGFHEFCRLVFGFGRIHSRELGQLSGGLFTSLTKKVISVTANQLDRYLLMDRTELTDQQEAAMFYNLGILLEGLTTLGCLTSSAPEQLYHKIIAVLDQGISKVTEGCTMNRILTFLVQTRRAMGYAMESYLSPVTEAALNHFATSGLISKLARPEQIDLAHILLGVNNYPSLTQASKQQFNLLVRSLRDDLVKNKEKLGMITLNDTSTMLVLFQATNQLDIPAKNAIKVKFRNEILLSPNLMSYVVPRSMECLAIAELKDANKFYNEYSNPLELLFMKSVFGIRASEFDRTPKFEVYQDMYKFATSHAEKLNKKELLSMIDALCVIELPIETFNFSLLEKSVQEMLIKKPNTSGIDTNQPLLTGYDTQLSSRMALLYSILGVENLQNKWLRSTLEAIQAGARFSSDSAQELIMCYSLPKESDMKEPEIANLWTLFSENLDLMIAQVLKYMNQLSDSKKTLLAWKLSQFPTTNKEIVTSILHGLKPESLRTLDRLLLSQVQGAQEVVTSIDEVEIAEFYESMFFKTSHILENDVNTTYSKLISAFNQAKVPLKEKVILREKDAYEFVPLYILQKKESLMLYPEDLFLKQLEMSQTRDQGFEYKMVKTAKLPPFFERNEELLRSVGIKVERLSSTEAKARFSVQNADLELAGFDDISTKKRLSYAGSAKLSSPAEERTTQQVSVPKKSTSARKPRQKSAAKQESQPGSGSTAPRQSREQ